MKPQPRPEDVRLWSIVTATVRPGPGRRPVVAPEAPEPQAKAKGEAPPPKPFAPAAHQTPQRPAPKPPPEGIEPGRKRRLTRERDPIDQRLDLHGLDQDRARQVLTAFLIRARAALHAFVARAQADGVRAVLVITGKGFQGDGILRRRTPEWLSDPILRPVVAGVSEAHRRHGGEGALYVALKRKA